MAKKARRYSAEFKARAVRLCEESGRPIAEIARELEVQYQTLYDWMAKAGKTKVTVDSALRVAAQRQETPEEEVRRLRRELDETTMERDFLKKAAAFFARMNK